MQANIYMFLNELDGISNIGKYMKKYSMIDFIN